MVEADFLRRLRPRSGCHLLAEDPAHRSIRDELTARVLDGWDPDEVTRKMAMAQRDEQVMRQWAETVDTPDPHRWDLRPEMDYVDGP